ncbi:Superoxide dismutase [Ophiocordyceps camponoti-floridani]|uniref:Superoxide dismutase n=1 Tax=Ophiocordyceps camponoti-floridani TaxID=2030778 RepID=A0A8H4VE78_9HYPO|nr:Superoxide dismutase [Ophiocordyceps camponoti-floridani]
MSVTVYKLPKLGFAYNALEPSISAQIMELHHSKHHQAYIDNLNRALESQAAAIASGDLPGQMAQQAAIRFNGGGHINHTLFWEGLTAAGSAEADAARAAPQLVAAIEGGLGGFDRFRAVFRGALLGVQGSGWGWLVREAGSGRALRVVTTKDQDPVVEDVPIFGVDMWEHAYYLQYLNGKAAYVDNIWNVINWKTAEARFCGGLEDAFQGLKASLD